MSINQITDNVPTPEHLQKSIELWQSVVYLTA